MVMKATEPHRLGVAVLAPPTPDRDIVVIVKFTTTDLPNLDVI